MPLDESELPGTSIVASNSLIPIIDNPEKAASKDVLQIQATKQKENEVNSSVKICQLIEVSSKNLSTRNSDEIEMEIRDNNVACSNV